MAPTIKQIFGKMLRKARDNKGLSRGTLADRLGISPKTVQSWEEGRTFIANLSLIPILDEMLDISVLQLTGDAISAFTKKRVLSKPKRKAGRPAVANGSHDALARVPRKHRRPYRPMGRRDIIEALRSRARQGLSLKYGDVRKDDRSLVSQSDHVFGNWRTALAAAGLKAERYRIWSKQAVREAIKARAAAGKALDWKTVMKEQPALGGAAGAH